MKPLRHFLALSDVKTEEILALLDAAAQYKAERARGARSNACEGKIIGLFFEKASLRTRLSFEVAIRRLGGASLFETTEIGRREPIADFARVSSRYLDALVLRTYRQSTIEEVARYATVPVVNALSDAQHPCQALGDLLTIRERKGRLEGLRVVFVGDGNNVARSLAIGCVRLGARFILSAPEGYGFDEAFLLSEGLNGRVESITDPVRAVHGADVIYTDVWVSMGQEKERAERVRRFRPFQVNTKLMAEAAPDAVFLHCLPAIREEEVTAEVLDGPQSAVYDQAENRLYVQQAVLQRLLA